MVNSKATEIFEINQDTNLNDQDHQDHLSNNIPENLFQQSNDYGIKNLPKIFPFKRSNISDLQKESNCNKRFDRNSLKNYNSKLSRSKLKAVIRTSTLLSGFAMIAMVEFELDYEGIFETIFKNSSTSSNDSKTDNNDSDHPISETFYIIFGCITCLLIGVHIIALMMSTCILPQLEALSYEDFEIQPSKDDSEKGQSKVQLPQNFFVKKINVFDTSHFNFPYQRFHKYIETAWILSTFIGLFLFILEVCIIIYIKLLPVSKIALYFGASIMICTLFLFIILSFVLYKRITHFRLKTTKNVISQLELNEFII